jgi:uncharacterized protein
MSDKLESGRKQRSRRDFLKVGGAIGATAILSQTVAASVTSNRTTHPSNPITATAMPTRNLGKTGFRVGIFSLGGQGALERGNNHDVAVPIIERALDLGVNYIDTSAIYGGPERWSEQYVGAVMKKRRNEAFLATKTRERSRDDSMRMIEKSLTLLNTDHVDLWQLHDIGTMNDVNKIFAKGGAIEALQQARDQGMVRYLGFTGHFRPDSLMECMRRFDFDTVLMAVSAADKHHYSFSDELVPMAVEKQLGIIGMKIPGRGRLLTSWDPPPIEKQKHMWEGSVIATQPGTLNMREAMYYALTLPISTVIIGIDTLAQLEENVQLAREYTPYSDKQMAAISQRAEPVSKQALFFRFMDRA